MMILRKGRLTKELLGKIATFMSSIEQDRDLARYDIKQSIIHCKYLQKAGMISDKESQTIVSSLEKIKKGMDNNADYFEGEYDDIHMAIEEKLGDLGKKLHAGRSRNDQVSCDMRMYVRDSIKRLIGGLESVCRVIKEKDLQSSGREVIMPSYTHLQKAQAVDLSVYLDTFVSWFKRDIERLESLFKRTNLLPLGAAAGASTNIKLDWMEIANELGFDGVISNPMDSVSSRDYIQEYASVLAILASNLSRMAEDFIIFASKEFSFVELDESIADTSSIMPQKKNPDCFELIRSAAAKIIGLSSGLNVLMKGLPLMYNRDMQDDKIIIESAKLAEQIVDLLPDIYKNITFNAERMCKAASEGFIDAADFAEYLVLKGVDFRDAHQRTGTLVKKGIEKGYTNLSCFKLEEIKEICPEAEEDVFEFIEVNNAVSRRLH